MTWTYNETLPANLDKVRLLIGDTDADDQQLQDEAIAFHLTEEGSVYAAAAACARSLMAHYARRVTFSSAGLSLAASERVRHYTTLALTLERRASSAAGNSLGAAVVGGVSEAELTTAREDTDAVQPRIRHDLHEREATDPLTDTAE